MSETRTSSGGAFLLLFLAVALVACALIALSDGGLGDVVSLWERYNEHATHRHPEAAPAIRAELECGGSLHHSVNPTTNRSADVCQLPDGMFGVQICDADGCEVTSFPRKTAKSLQDVIDYLTRTGYK